MAIRSRLRDILDQRRMTQVELQMKSGLAYSTINELYLGKTRQLKFDTLDALCSALNCEVGDILEYIPGAKRRRS